MPIWFELIILLLLTYCIGLGAGWAIWGRDMAGEIVEFDEDETP